MNREVINGRSSIRFSTLTLLSHDMWWQQRHRRHEWTQNVTNGRKTNKRKFLADLINQYLQYLSQEWCGWFLSEEIFGGSEVIGIRHTKHFPLAWITCVKVKIVWLFFWWMAENLQLLLNNTILHLRTFWRRIICCRGPSTLDLLNLLVCSFLRFQCVLNKKFAFSLL